MRKASRKLGDLQYPNWRQRSVFMTLKDVRDSSEIDVPERALVATWNSAKAAIFYKARTKTTNEVDHHLIGSTWQ